jgi:hypothetical protein
MQNVNKKKRIKGKYKKFIFKSLQSRQVYQPNLVYLSSQISALISQSSHNAPKYPWLQ